MNAVYLYDIVDHIKAARYERAIKTMDYLVGREVRQLALNAKRALVEGKPDIALCLINRCFKL